MEAHQHEREGTLFGDGDVNEHEHAGNTPMVEGLVTSQAFGSDFRYKVNVDPRPGVLVTSTRPA
jgi:hypothetical protein